MYMDIVVKGELRQQLQDILSANPNCGIIYVMDIKSRLRVLGDDLATFPFKRPVALDLPSFKKALYALWSDPKQQCLSLMIQG